MGAGSSEPAAEDNIQMVSGEIIFLSSSQTHNG